MQRRVAHDQAHPVGMRGDELLDRCGEPRACLARGVEELDDRYPGVLRAHLWKTGGDGELEIERREPVEAPRRPQGYPRGYRFWLWSFRYAGAASRKTSG